MHKGNTLITNLAIRCAGAAAFLLAMGMLGAAAPAHGDSGPRQTKAQAKPVERKVETPKKEEAKTAPVKLGLSVNTPKALQGYTLFSPFVSPYTYLLDMQGKVVRTWQSDCSVALSATLLENGHLLRPGSIGDDARVFGPGRVSAGESRSSPGMANWFGISSSTARGSFRITI